MLLLSIAVTLTSSHNLPESDSAISNLAFFSSSLFNESHHHLKLYNVQFSPIIGVEQNRDEKKIGPNSQAEGEDRLVVDPAATDSDSILSNKFIPQSKSDRSSLARSTSNEQLNSPTSGSSADYPLPIGFTLATNPDSSSSATEQRTYLAQAHLQFTLDLMGNLLYREHVRPTDLLVSSFTFSPLSVQSLLMMLHLVAGGHTRQQIANTLHLANLLPPPFEKKSNQNPHPSLLALGNPLLTNSNISMAHQLFANQLQDLLEAKQVRQSLRMASKLLYRLQLRVRPRLQRVLAQLYGPGCVQPLDFSDPERAQQWINDFVAQTTNGEIGNFLSTAPPASTPLMAVNAIHFRSDWRYGFDRQDTEINGEFHLNNGRRVRHSIMVGTLPVAFGQSSSLKVSAIELPYRPVSRLSMFFLLPDDIQGLLPMLRSLNATSLYKLISQMRKQPTGVNVRLPRFRVDSQHPLQTVLSAMGLRSLFSAGECDLSPLFSNPSTTVAANAVNNNGVGSSATGQQSATNTVLVPGSSGSNGGLFDSLSNHVGPVFGASHWFGPLHVAEFVHRASLRIDEQGSVASAASATLVERVGLFNGPYFEADHPFVFMLMDKQSGLVLFAGVYAGPNGQHPTL